MFPFFVCLLIGQETISNNECYCNIPWWSELGIEVQLYPIPRHMGMVISSQRASFLLPTPDTDDDEEAPTDPTILLPLLEEEEEAAAADGDPLLLLLDSCAQSIQQKLLTKTTISPKSLQQLPVLLSADDMANGLNLFLTHAPLSIGIEKNIHVAATHEIN